MRKIVLYIAMSLDGYLADSEGGVAWLTGHSGSAEPEGTYSAFLPTVDTVVMGWNTYHQITTELSPGEWVYPSLTSYVITHRALPSTGNINFVQDDPCSLIERLRSEPGKAVWVCGGGNILQPLLQRGLIDEYDISIIPTLLGSGIRLFGPAPRETRLKLLRTQVYNGITELVYVRRQDASEA